MASSVVWLQGRTAPEWASTSILGSRNGLGEVGHFEISLTCHITWYIIMMALIWRAKSGANPCLYATDRSPRVVCGLFDQWPKNAPCRNLIDICSQNSCSLALHVCSLQPMARFHKFQPHLSFVQKVSSHLIKWWKICIGKRGSTSAKSFTHVPVASLLTTSHSATAPNLGEGCGGEYIMMLSATGAPVVIFWFSIHFETSKSCNKSLSY
jgi:hypothetical protein